MSETQEDISSLDAVLYAFQNEPIEQYLQDLKKIHQKNDISELLKLNKSQQFKNYIFDDHQLTSLYFLLAKDHHFYESFSFWCLNYEVVPQMGFLKWVMLISLTYRKNLEASSMMSHDQSQVGPNPRFLQQSYQGRMSRLVSSSQDHLQQQQAKNEFLENKQNEQMYELLVKALQDNTHEQQLFVWRQLIYKINQSNQNNCLRLARQYFQKGDYQATRKVLSKIRELQPQADELRANCYKQLGELSQAISQMKLAINNKNGHRHPEPQRCSYAIAQMCITLQRFAEAVYYLQECLSNAESIELRLEHATYMLQTGMHQNAMDLLTRLTTDNHIPLNCQHQAKMLTLMGHSQRQLGSSIEEVLEKYRQALYYHHFYIVQSGQQMGVQELYRKQRSFQNSIEYFKGLTFFNFKSYDYKDSPSLFNYKYRRSAKNSFQICIHKDPDFLQPYIFLVRLNLIQGSYSEIMHSLDRIIDLIQLEKNASLELIELMKEMLAEIKKSRVFEWTAPKSIESIDQQRDSDLMVKLKVNMEGQEKLKIIQTWVKLQAEKIAEQLLQSALHFFQVQLYKMSLLILPNLKKIKPNQEKAYIICGKCYFEVYQYQKAELEFKQALKCDRKSLGALKGLLVLHTAQNNQEQMLKWCQQLVKAYSKMQKTQIQQRQEECMYQRKLGILLKSKKVNEAVHHIVKSLQWLAADESCFLFILHIYLQQYDTKPLIEAMQKSRQKKISCLDRREWIILYLMVGQRQKARQQLGEFIPANEEEEKCFKNVHEICNMLTKDCQIPYLRASSNSIKEYLNQFRNQNSDEDAQQNQKTRNIFRRTAIALRVAEQLYKAKCYEQATYFYEIVTQFTQNQKFIKKLKGCYKAMGSIQKHNALCYSLIEKLQGSVIYQKNPEQAQIEQPKIDLNKTNSTTIKELIQLYKQTSSSEKLYSLLREAVSKKTNNPIFLSDMIDLQCQKQNVSAAVEYLNKMIEFEPMRAFQKMVALSQSSLNLPNCPQYDQTDKRTTRFVFLSKENLNKPIVLTLFYLYFEFNQEAFACFGNILKGFQAMLVKVQPNRAKLTLQVNNMLLTLKKMEVKMANNTLVRIMTVLLQQYTKKQPNATNGIIESLASFEKLQDYITTKQKQDFEELTKSYELLVSSYEKLDYMQGMSFRNVDFKEPNAEIIRKWIRQSAQLEQNQMKRQIQKIRGFGKQWVKFVHSLKWLTLKFSKQQQEEQKQIFKQFEEGNIAAQSIKEWYLQMLSSVEKVKLFEMISAKNS